MFFFQFKTNPIGMYFQNDRQPVDALYTPSVHIILIRIILFYPCAYKVNVYYCLVNIYYYYIRIPCMYIPICIYYLSTSGVRRIQIHIHHNAIYIICSELYQKFPQFRYYTIHTLVVTFIISCTLRIPFK